MFISTLYREYSSATAAPAVHTVTGAKQNPSGNRKAFLTKHNPTVSKWYLPEPCIILQVHRAGQPVWVLLGSKICWWICTSGVLQHD